MARRIPAERPSRLDERGSALWRRVAPAAAPCLAALLSVTNACSLAERPPPYPSFASRDALPDGHASEAVSVGAAAVEHRGLVRSGTGFFVSRDGLLLTSAHVVAGCAAISVWRRDEPAYPIRLIAADRRRDLALLATGVAAPDVAAAPKRWRPRSGERVAVLGFGVYADRPLEPVLLHGGLTHSTTTPDGRPAFVVRAKVRRGTSGAPVLDQNGALVGMVVGYYADRPDLAIVASNTDIAAFLAAHGVRLPASPDPPRRPFVVDHLLLDASALVQCVPAHGGNERLAPRPQEAQKNQ